MSNRRLPLILLLFAGFLAPLSSAQGAMAILRNGRMLSVTEHRREGDKIVLVMDGGGQISLQHHLVVAIRPDPLPPPPDILPTEEGPATGLPDVPGKGALPSLSAATGQDLPALAPGAVFDRQALRDLAARIARRHKVDERLVQAVIEVESRYDAFAVSPKGAMGLMQLMPQTAVRFAVENAFDPVQNVDGGVRYLKELLHRYSGEIRLALAAYNAGEDAVDRYRGIPPYRETRNYVARIARIIRR